MSESSPASHKRSKSTIARSLLHRVSSRQDVPTFATPDSEATRSPADGPSASTRDLSLAPTAAPSLLPTRTSNIGQRPALASIMSTDGVVQDAALSDKAALDASPSVPHGTSIEQSVRLFKVFEALRSGDTAALSTAMGADAGQDEPSAGLQGTTVVHLAVQCAEPSVVDFVVKLPAAAADLNARDRDGNTPLHIASMLGRTQVVDLLLNQPSINDSLANSQGKVPLDLARNPDVFQRLQLARSIFVESNIKNIQVLVQTGAYDKLEQLLADSRIRSSLDVNGPELPTDSQTVDSGGSLLHEAARKRDTKLAQILLLNGADPFRRDRKGKLPQDVTKDDRTRAIFKKSPAAAVAQRGIQEKAILGTAGAQAAGNVPGDVALGAKEAREMKGYLKKWTNYTSGYKLRWFVLEDGVMSYYKHQDDAGSACRGAINMRIATLHMDPKDKLGFEIHGKSSVKYHLKANHQVEAKRWFWSLNNAIQWSKDEAREEERRQKQDSEALRQARTGQLDKANTHESLGGTSLAPGAAIGSPVVGGGSSFGGSIAGDREGSTYDPSTAGDDVGRGMSHANTATLDGDLDDDDDYGDDASSHEAHPANKDAFNITAQSAKLQLDLLSQVSKALQVEKTQNPELPLSHPSVSNALTSYDTAVQNLKGLMLDLLRISRDHDAYWQYRLDRETNVRRLWEDSMARVAMEQEELQGRIGESEDKRLKTKRALRDVLEGRTPANATTSRRQTQSGDKLQEAVANIELNDDETTAPKQGIQRKLTIADLTNNEISDDESDIEDEFYDAVDAGEVEVVGEMPAVTASTTSVAADSPSTDIYSERIRDIERSYKGYEDGIRKRLKLDADNRPKVSLWAVLKSMIGKDMTKMTLPVSFNEPTSLLYRVVEDMEYTDLLNTAADRSDSTERMVYVAAFAASEYASTIGRVAKPFNPLLGETYEYVRPDKGYRFFIEQVSHHPPVGAAYAESAKWDYFGESSVKSKFYGKSFEFNPLGTWFLRLRPSSGGPEELYTWKKVTSSVVGIITGSPTVDNYGPMEIKNWTTGEVCTLDFKARGWKANSAYQVTGKVADSQGKIRWSMGGRWNDKIYARLTPGFEGAVEPGKGDSASQAFLVWEAHERPTGIPFNLTPFAVTLNSLPDRLKPVVAPTDTRLRPDQRAMEDGEYDFAATEKTRVEEKQRAKRRAREQAGEEFTPRWFKQQREPVTGEMFWSFNQEYWKIRADVAEGKGKWEDLEDIF